MGIDGSQRRQATSDQSADGELAGAVERTCSAETDVSGDIWHALGRGGFQFGRVGAITEYPRTPLTSYGVSGAIG
jgi:hypothetical protein